MPQYSLNSIDAGLLIDDVPLAYTTARGSGVELALKYHSREGLQPQTFSFGNVGHRWMYNWLSYLLEVPAVAGPNGGYYPEYVDVQLRGGGAETLVGPPAPDGSYGTFWRTRSGLIRVSQDPIRYERRQSDGSVEVFAQPDGAPAGQWRRVFLTDVIDPQGNSLHFTYDAQLRLAAITDAAGLVTTLAYEWAPDPLKLTRVMDPFGRTAVLTYMADGLLASVTDMLGMTSSFTYENGDFIAGMTTPYGTTTFRKESNPDSASARWLSEDPAGAKDGLNLYRYVSNSPINRLDRLGLAGQKCWDKLTVTSVFSCSAELVIPAVNDTLTLKVGPCTATMRLNGQFLVRGEMGTRRGCK